MNNFGYLLRSVKADKSDVYHYFVSFTDSNGTFVEIEVTEKVYNELLRSHKKDAAQRRSDRRHLEKSEQTEDTITLKSFVKDLSLDEQAIRKFKNERLHNAIQKLPYKQRKRIELYFFQGKKLKEIGIVDNCTPQAVHKSIKRALIKLYCILSEIYP